MIFLIFTTQKFARSAANLELRIFRTKIYHVTWRTQTVR